jgi:hypothetical protein
MYYSCCRPTDTHYASRIAIRHRAAPSRLTPAAVDAVCAPWASLGASTYGGPTAMPSQKARAPPPRRVTRAAAAAAALQQSEPLDDNGGRQQRAGSSAAAACSEVHSQDQATAGTKKHQRAGCVSAPPDAGEGRSGGGGQCESGKGKRRRVKGAAAKIGFPPRENGAVGLPNSSGSDCFWISALQCIRHAPGYVSALRHCLGSIPQVCWELRPFQSGFQRRLQAHEMTYGCVCLRDLQQRMDLGTSSNTPEREEEEGTRVGLPSRWSLICCVRRRH